MRLGASMACAALVSGCSLLTTVDELSSGGPIDAGPPDVTVLAEAGPDAADARIDDAPSALEASSDATDANATDARDAGPDGPTPDPGRVPCGPNTCKVGDNLTFCCDYGAAAPDSGCITDEGACPVIEIFCDEQSDCSGGHVCCLARDNAGDFASAFCYAECRNPPSNVGVRLCKTAAECDAGQACLPALCRNRLYYTCNGALPPMGCN